MRRSTLLLPTAVLATTTVAHGQTCLTRLYDDDFDAYTAGLPLLPQQACQPECPPGLSWQPWDGDPDVGGAAVSDRVARSAPNSLAIRGGDPGPLDDLVHTFHDLALFGGTYELRADVYVPGDFTGDSYFILLNRYEPGGDKGWSAQIRWSDAGQVISDFDDGVQHDVTLIPDAWVPLRVVMDFDTDTQHVLYGDAHVISKRWCAGITCTPTLEALDLYGNDASPVYYDDLRLCAIPPTCDEDVDVDSTVGFADLLRVLSAWGPDEDCPPRRREDVDGNCVVEFADLLRVLAAWGPCA